MQHCSRQLARSSSNRKNITVMSSFRKLGLQDNMKQKHHRWNNKHFSPQNASCESSQSLKDTQKAEKRDFWLHWYAFMFVSGNLLTTWHVNTQFVLYTLIFCKHLATLTLITCPGPGKNLGWGTRRSWLRPGTLTTYMFVYIHMPHEAWKALLTEDPRKEKNASEVALFLGQYLVHGMCFCWHCCCCYCSSSSTTTANAAAAAAAATATATATTTTTTTTTTATSRYCCCLLVVGVVGVGVVGVGVVVVAVVVDCWLLKY